MIIVFEHNKTNIGHLKETTQLGQKKINQPICKNTHFTVQVIITRSCHILTFYYFKREITQLLRTWSSVAKNLVCLSREDPAKIKTSHSHIFGRFIS